MKVDMVMPQMGESIAEGTIVKWRKNIGDSVEKDEMILDISTDKVDSEIPSPASGILAEVLAEEGKTVNVGVVIARIETDSSVKVDAASGSKTAEIKVSVPAVAPAPSVEAKSNAAAASEAPLKTEGERPIKFLSPLVKKIAKEQDIPLEEIISIDGSGARGRITKNDILSFIVKREHAPAEYKPTAAVTREAPIQPPVTIPASSGLRDDLVEIIPMDHVRKRIAEHMVLSKQTAPHVTSVAEADLTRLVAYREKVKDIFEQREGVKLTYTSFFVSAAARALKEFPLINSSVEGDNIIQKKYINIGFAVGMEKGLIVPVIKNADQLNLIGLARALADLSNRARTKQLKPDDVQGGTFSITNIGTFGNLFGTPIINQPQVAILGTGAIKKRPVVIDDAIAIRSMAYISLTYDHRIIDGLYGGSFLQRLLQILEKYELDEVKI
jgi:2-oxoglutarate dehydrogenase dihydrolipoamide succinyltransferase (E2 component)